MKYLKNDNTLTVMAMRFIESLKDFEYKRLSSFYMSQTTNYPKILDSDLFVITDNKSEIVNAGFSIRTKRIIKLNPLNKYAKKGVAILEKNEKAQARLIAAEKRDFKKQITAAKKFCKQYPDIVEKIKSKYGRKHKDLQTIAWRLSVIAENKKIQISKAAFRQVI